MAGSSAGMTEGSQKVLGFKNPDSTAYSTMAVSYTHLHQAICEVYGATISHARCLMHGKQSCIKINTDSLIFRGLPEEVPVARYHSLAAQRDTMPDCLTIIGEDAYGEVMAVKHRDFPVYGLQFHPESILTPDGKKMMRNFLLLQ